MRRDEFLKSMAAIAGLGALPLAARAAGLNIKMMIPANPGGGWDTTGRALGKALQDAKAVESVQYENKGGAAGALGLAQFVNGKPEEIVFVRGATEAINLVAQSWAGSQLKAGDRILLSVLEHHSNIVPWQLVAEKIGVEIDVVPLASRAKSRTRDDRQRERVTHVLRPRSRCSLLWSPGRRHRQQGRRPPPTRCRRGRRRSAAPGR